jgi:hypothetical protein
LSALLPGKALEAYSWLSPESSEDYDEVRGAILKRDELTGEAYRKKLRNTKRENETFSEWPDQLSGSLARN